MPEITTPKVFISYSHDSDEHRDYVRELANRLRKDGVDCLIDQYINGFPPEGWQIWMENQIEVADFVLLVCTQTYLRRYRKREVGGGKGVTFEGVVVSQHLYDAHFHNAKFIPVIFDRGNYEHVPVPLRAYSTYCLPDEYEGVYRVITGQALYIQPKLGQIRRAGRKVAVDRLPTVAGEFFGREAELQLLDEALAGNGTRIIQFIASGGTGKTKLLRHWLNKHQGKINNYIVWSFYSQGTSDSKQVSATPLFTEAFKAFGVDSNQFRTDEDRADALGDLLTEHQCLLVLDGLEPLQHGGKGMDGRLKDRAMTRLLQRLVQQHTSLCIITTRIHVYNISDRVHVLSYPLDNLETADGIQLLRSLRVYGREQELEAAVNEVEGHALTLHLLGNALTTYLDADIRKRDLLSDLVDEDSYEEKERHAFKVMQAYQYWLRDEHGKPTAELQLLYLLGLFDHPIEIAVLKVLWGQQIVGLTSGISAKTWMIALKALQEKHRLLSQHGKRPDLLDCHPLIREYFGRQLRQHHPESWQQAHEALYYYYKALPKTELPDTIEEMQPLFHAVCHGCKAGLHQKALDEVYWPSIQRKGKDYIVKKLGAFSDDLAVLANFFSQPWHEPVVGLIEHDQAGGVLNWAGFLLRALGRLSEAEEPIQTGMELRAKQGKWKSAAMAANNLSGLQLTLGRVTDAMTNGEYSVVYADQSEDIFWRMGTRTTYANAMHQAGKTDKALALFAETEALQHAHESEFPRLYAGQGFRYCDLLLTQDSVAEVLERTTQTIEIAKRNEWMLSVGLDKLTFGRAHHALGNLRQARNWLEQAVADLCESGRSDYLPRGLLSRAAIYRDLGEFELAQQDLAEVWELTEAGEMRLFITDYYLEMARLLLKVGNNDEVPHHIIQADHLITETGYHRRDQELADLKAQIA